MKHLITFFLALGLATVLHAQDVSFVTHPSTPADQLSAKDISDILSGNLTKWEHGAVIRLAVQTSGDIHTKTVRDYTQRTPDQFEKFWKKQVFTGKGSMPELAKSDADMIAYVARTPGAFGYVAAASVTPQVKVITTK